MSYSNLTPETTLTLEDIDNKYKFQSDYSLITDNYFNNIDDVTQEFKTQSIIQSRFKALVTKIIKDYNAPYSFHKNFEDNLYNYGFYLSNTFSADYEGKKLDFYEDRQLINFGQFGAIQEYIIEDPEYKNKFEFVRYVELEHFLDPSSNGNKLIELFNFNYKLEKEEGNYLDKLEPLKIEFALPAKLFNKTEVQFASFLNLRDESFYENLLKERFEETDPNTVNYIYTRFIPFTDVYTIKLTPEEIDQYFEIYLKVNKEINQKVVDMFNEFFDKYVVEHGLDLLASNIHLIKNQPDNIYF